MKLKGGIAIDSWKRSIFERHLAQAGYAFEVGPFVTGTVLFTVKTENVAALEIVCRAANAEAALTGPPKEMPQ